MAEEKGEFEVRKVNEATWTGCLRWRLSLGSWEYVSDFSWWMRRRDKLTFFARQTSPGSRSLALGFLRFFDASSEVEVEEPGPEAKALSASQTDRSTSSPPYEKDVWSGLR